MYGKNDQQGKVVMSSIIFFRNSFKLRGRISKQRVSECPLCVLRSSVHFNTMVNEIYKTILTMIFLHFISIYKVLISYSAQAIF
jgi:hypothetical protein